MYYGDAQNDDTMGIGANKAGEEADIRVPSKHGVDGPTNVNQNEE